MGITLLHLFVPKATKLLQLMSHKEGAGKPVWTQHRWEATQNHIWGGDSAIWGGHPDRVLHLTPQALPQHG